MLFGLPNCDQVFKKYFDHWYSPEDRQRKFFPAARPDVLVDANLIGLPPQEASPLTPEGLAKTAKMVDTMVEAAAGDWPNFLSVAQPMDISWIEAFDRFHDERTVKAVLKRSNPREFGNELLVRCCEFGAVLGHMLISMQSDLYWRYDRPYWESSVVDPKTGQLVAVFHWAIKKFSSYGIRDGYEAKLLACSRGIERERGR